MAKITKSKSDKNDKEKVQKDIEQIVAESLAKKFPLYEAGRNVVGFLNGMVTNAITERVTDLLRGHTREMQGEIADAIRVYVIFQEIDLTGIRHVDDELDTIFEMYDNLLTS